MVTAEELTLAIRSEGVSDTRDELEGVESAMDETAESAGDSAEELQGFSERFAGAMTAAVTALAVGAAGLLSQVPVLGEAFGGLSAIVAALAFQMDGVLRPVLSPLTDAFFAVSNAIFEAEGIVGGFIGAIATLASLAAIVIPAIAAIGAQLGTFASVGAGVTSILGTIAGAITTVIGVIAGLPLALTAAVAAVVAFAAAYALNLGGVRDKTDAIVGDIIGFLGNLAAGARDKLSGVIDAFIGLAGDLVEWAGNLASDAYNWGVNLINRFIAGIKSAISGAQDFLGGVADSIGIDIPDVGGSVSVGGTGAGGGGGVANTAATAFADRGRARGRGGGTQLDGRQLTESTGRYRSDPARRQGL